MYLVVVMEYLAIEVLELVAVMEYLATEVLELAKDNKRN